MTRINNIVKEGKKFKAHMFFRHAVESISKIYLEDTDASLNELIAFYVKEAICSKGLDNDQRLLDGYMNVAILLAFVNRITTPFSTPSSLEELFNNENLTSEDIIAECVGLLVKAIFEDNPESIKKYSSCLYEYTEKLLDEEDIAVSDDSPEAVNSYISESLSKSENEELS